MIEYIENLDVGTIQDAVLDFLFNIDWAGVFGKLIKLLAKVKTKISNIEYGILNGSSKKLRKTIAINAP